MNAVDNCYDLGRKKILDEFVDELPRMRKRFRISQTDLGNMVGLSRQTISLIERKQLPLTWNNYLAIMMFFCLNSGSIYYFPKNNRGCKNYELLQQVMKVNDKEENDI